MLKAYILYVVYLSYRNHLTYLTHLTQAKKLTLKIKLLKIDLGNISCEVQKSPKMRLTNEMLKRVKMVGIGSHSSTTIIAPAIILLDALEVLAQGYADASV